ncbi:MAG TPA: SAM-dependent methyltransferase, partial [Beijerinckiaceae bacterium]|nr:SAM-dependent methyltransferase [Beijerinckiaceae bacterium]
MALSAGAVTRLIDELRETIALEGPMSVARYMSLCLAHPRHGYYITRDPLGHSGDFTTAPEVSQMFGELVGLWAAGVWDGFGRPERIRLVELGPGRGTLMADAMRAARALPAFRKALSIHLVEISPTLRQRQQERLASLGIPVVWHDRIEDVPAGGAEIILANEFFDALPIHQFIVKGGVWRERLVGLGEAGQLQLGVSETPASVPFAAAAEGDVRELCPAGLDVVASLARRWQAGPGALLAIDYGYARPRSGDSFQALKGHRHADVLADPGEADLTAHVDFSALAQAARAAGLMVAPLLTQATLL